jgi:hypothetical protein
VYWNDWFAVASCPICWRTRKAAMAEKPKHLQDCDHQRMPQGEDPEIGCLLTIKTTSLPTRP